MPVLQRLTQSLAFAIASYNVAGLPCNYTIVSLTAVSGYTLTDQVTSPRFSPPGPPGFALGGNNPGLAVTKLLA